MAIPSKEEDLDLPEAPEVALERHGFMAGKTGDKSDVDQPTENGKPAAISALARLMVRVFPYGFLKSSLVSCFLVNFVRLSIEFLIPSNVNIL